MIVFVCWFIYSFGCMFVEDCNSNFYLLTLYLLEIMNLSEFNTELKRYGKILADNQNDATNTRITEIEYLNKFYLVVMRHGEVLSIKEILKRKQLLKNNLIQFAKINSDSNEVYTVGTDLNKSYFIYKGMILSGDCFNLNAKKIVKANLLSKDTVYYISTIKDSQRSIFGLNN